jgi:glycosyltransferase involved in cell wall biosynthesis
MKISVVIPTYNRLALLKNTLESLARQTFNKEDFEVLVIDDGSTDGTREWLQEQKFPYRLRVFFPDHGGAAKARNLGIQEASGEVILFTDDDCSPSAHLINLHFAAHSSARKKKNLVVRGPVVIVKSIKEIETNEQSESNGLPSKEFQSSKSSILNFSMNFFCTSNASVRKEWLLKAGLFDESFQRWEDAELGFKLRNLGLKMKFILPAVVFHLKPQTSLQDFIRTAEADGRSAAQLYQKHPCLRTWFSCGYHPLNLFSGKLLAPVVDKKTAQMKPDNTVSAFWQPFIYKVYFVKGLLKAKN